MLCPPVLVLVTVASSVMTVIKYGMIEMRSITFMMLLKNLRLLGQTRKRTAISKTNQMMQAVSMMKKGSVTVVLMVLELALDEEIEGNPAPFVRLIGIPMA